MVDIFEGGDPQDAALVPLILCFPAEPEPHEVLIMYSAHSDLRRGQVCLLLHRAGLVSALPTEAVVWKKSYGRN